MAARQVRLERLRRLAEHPNTNPHEAANARAEIARLCQVRGAPAPERAGRTARVCLDGLWLLVAVPIAHFDEAREVLADALGSCGRVSTGELAVYDADVAVRAAAVDALRGSGYQVDEVVPRALAGASAAP